MLNPDARFSEAIRLFDAANDEDPNRVPNDDGRLIAKEVLYARRMSATLARVRPDAPETVRLAVRCQHLCRWRIARADFPLTRAGYHQWRNALKRYHAELAGQLLAQAGYAPAPIARVQALVQKLGLAHDPEVQLLEDVVCLVFLEHYLLPFAAQHPEAKVTEILQKTWVKMSAQSHQLALQLPLTAEAQRLVGQALAG